MPLVDPWHLPPGAIMSTHPRLCALQDKRHERTVKLLLHQVPEVVAGSLMPKLEALADGAQALADEAGRATDQLAAGGAGQGAGGRGGDPLWDVRPGYRYRRAGSQEPQSCRRSLVSTRASRTRAPSPH